MISLCHVCALGTAERCPVMRSGVRACAEYLRDRAALRAQQDDASRTGDWQTMQQLCALELGLASGLDDSSLEATQ